MKDPSHLGQWTTMDKWTVDNETRRESRTMDKWTMDPENKASPCPLWIITINQIMKTKIPPMRLQVRG
ncbi:unnamed protein product [Prunus brigantina]